MERLIGVDTAAEMLGVSMFTVRRYIRLGGIPSVNVGARLMVSEAEVVKIQREGLAKIPVPKKDTAKAKGKGKKRKNG